jgi:uncharacterized protein DUF4126
MKLSFDILQAAGLGAACGMSPFVAALAAGFMARAQLGVDFDGTSYAFLENLWFLLGVTIALVLTTLTRNFWVGVRADALATVGVVFGALEGAGSLADNGHSAAIGAVVGGLCAVLAAYVVRDLLGRVGARLDAQAASVLPLYAHGAAILVVVAALAFPPLSAIVVGLLIWLAIRSRRRSAEKYAGLRSLR